MSSFYTWTGEGVVGKQCTIAVPVAKDDANGDPVVLDLSSVTPTVAAEKPNGDNFTATVSQSGVSGEEHVAHVVFDSSDVDSSGRYLFDLFIDGEPVIPRFAVMVRSAL